MKQYQRFVRFSSIQLEPDDDGRELEALLKDAPGIGDVRIVGEHPKGGFRAQFTLAPSDLEAFVLRLEQSDWRAAI